MRHLHIFDATGFMNAQLGAPLLTQKTIGTVCGRRVAYGTTADSSAHADCVDCIQAQNEGARVLEREVLKARRDDLYV